MDNSADLLKINSQKEMETQTDFSFLIFYKSLLDSVLNFLRVKKTQNCPGCSVINYDDFAITFDVHTCYLDKTKEGIQSLLHEYAYDIQVCFDPILKLIDVSKFWKDLEEHLSFASFSV